MKKHAIIPIFIPHRGCPNDCVFCNQKRITGSQKEVTADDVRRIIEEHLKTLPKENRCVEAAFFGGSFTGIPIEEQSALLSAANEYLAKGLPVIMGGMDDLFENGNGEYALCLSNNPSPVDFEEIGEFLDSVYLFSSKKEIIEHIRNFAKNNVDNSITLKPIVEYILCE